MIKQQNNICDNKKKEIRHSYEDNINIENKNNATCTIKKIEIKNNIPSCGVLRESTSNYLKNLEMYKNLPDSVIRNIINSKKYISPNHNILFHHYSKDKNRDKNKKNSGKIQCIIINTNLRTSLNKDNDKTRTLSNSKKYVYHKKNLIKAKSTIKANRLQKNKISESSIIANYETNYDYDCDNNNNNNDNYVISINNNSDKLNYIERNNYYTDMSLKEYLYNETKSLRTAFSYFDNQNKDREREKDKDIVNTESKNIQTIQPNLRLNSDIFNIFKIQKTEQNEIIQPKKYVNKKREEILTLRNNHTNNNKLRGKNKSQEYINSYSNRYKMKKYKINIGNNINNKNNCYRLLTPKSYNYLSSNGNFSIVNCKRKPFNEDKNNYKRKKNNIYINTQNFYNDSKIDYTSFRKKNKNIINNQKFSKQNNNNIFKNIKEKKYPCKLVKKDLTITTSALTKNKKINCLTTRHSSFGNSKIKQKLNLKIISEIKSDKNKNIKSNSTTNINSEKLNKKDNFKNKIEQNKNKIFYFNYKENKNINQNVNDCNTNGPLFTVKINYKDLLNYQSKRLNN